ncbi:unnamed protein product [Clonostachys rhizophaga]|uniref:Endonuclease/exonuclease/phosphatase domain-containing protein n=1 Tax=Clonostachys rhizophaga TaxID=160324 RepID=A0A9N9VAQ0_9HYPO|nr:unnamed protein product [Clonostachys rhizophaga]
MAETGFNPRAFLMRPTKPLIFLVASAAILGLTVSWLAIQYPGFIFYPAPAPINCPLEFDNDTTAVPPTHVGMDYNETLPLRLITYNIRYASKHPVANEKPWEIRCPKLVTQLKFITEGHDSPFICLQEVLDSQVHDVQRGLGAGWGHIGRGREKGETDGEFSPIFYRSSTWRLTRYETRWLSKTPDRPSRGWDAYYNRIVTMGEFAHRTTNTTVIVMSTHFDHMGAIAREHSADLLIKFAKEWSAASEADVSAVLIGGDFNSAPDDDSYRRMTAPGSGMSDIADLVPDSRKYGNRLTYTSFGEPEYGSARIDFLFIKEPRTALVKSYGVLANQFEDGVLISDHRPVVADLEVLP